METKGAVLSSVQKTEIFVRNLGDPRFQVGVGTTIVIHQTTVSKVVKEMSTKIAEKKKSVDVVPSNTKRTRGC